MISYVGVCALIISTAKADIMSVELASTAQEPNNTAKYMAFSIVAILVLAIFGCSYCIVHEDDYKRSHEPLLIIEFIDQSESAASSNNSRVLLFCQHRHQMEWVIGNPYHHKVP